MKPESRSPVANWAFPWLDIAPPQTLLGKKGVVEPWALTDYCFFWMRSSAKHGSGTSLNPLRAECVQQRSNTRQIEHSLGCEVVVGAPRNMIIFRASDAAKPFVMRNGELLELLAPQFEEQLRQYKEEDGFLKLVRRTTGLCLKLPENP